LLAVVTLLVGCSGGAQTVSWFGVAADDDTAYLAADEDVVALNLDGGTELWGFPVQPDRQEFGPFYATPLISGDVISVGGNGDGKLYALTQDRGTEQWAVETGAGIVGGPAPAGDAVVVGNNDGQVYLIDEATQQKRLLLQVDEAIWATPRVDEANGRIYVSAMDHRLYAVDLVSGDQLWAFEAGGALVGTPALSDRVVYVGTLTSKFFAVDAETGSELWQVDTEGWVWGGPLVVGNTVYFGDLNGNFYALDAKDGSQRWVFDADGGVRGTPAFADNVVYFGTRGGYVYALSAEDGTQEWVQTVSGAVYTQPVIRGDYLLISPHGAKVQLVALDPESGAERWSYPPQEE
jgi:outer membrane protein assembly factor BamB